MPSKQPMPGPGMSWMPGVWFGAGHAGGTAWMLTGTVEFAFLDRRLAILFLGSFLIANTVGLGLWMRRDRVAPYPAFQCFLLAIGILGALALVAIHLLYPGGIPQGPGGRPEQVPYFLILIWPLFMALLFFQERAQKASNSRRLLGSGQGVNSVR